MKISARAALLCGTTIAGMLLLGACGKKEEPAAPEPAPAASTPAIASTAALTDAPGLPATTAAPAAATSIDLAGEAPAAPAAPAISVTKLTLGSAVNAEHQVTRAATTFATTDKTIYASVATEGHTGGATLNAKWSYLEGKGQLVSNINQAITTDGPATTTFKVQNPDLWPEGKYKVEISLDGKPVSSQGFEIKKR